MTDTIAAALTSLKKAAEASIYRPVDYTVISIPQNFNVPTVRDAAVMAGFSFFPKKHAVQIIRFPKAVHISYDLGSCKGLGLPPECDMEDVHSVIWIDYTSTYLELRAIDVTEHSIIPYRHSKFPDLGDDVLGTGFAVSPLIPLNPSYI